MHEHNQQHIALCYFGRVDPAVYGIDYSLISSPRDEPFVAISSYYLVGLSERLPSPEGPIEYVNLPYAAELRQLSPFDRAGPTIFLFRAEDVAAAKEQWRKNSP
jgi:hypothetical protein